MTARDRLDRQLVAWLRADASTSAPEHLLGDVLARTARTRRRPAWRVPERWIPMSAITSRVTTPAGVPWRVVLLGALLVLAVVAGALVVAGSMRRSAPPPFGPAANGSLLYSKNGDLMITDSPTSQPRLLLGGDGFDNGAMMSPDGTSIVFVRGVVGGPDAELWTARADGSQARRLAPVPAIGWAEWAPASDAVAVLLDGSPSTISLVSAADGTVTRLETGLEEVQGVVWRPPDGAQLTLRGRDATGGWGLYSIGRDGSGLHRLALDAGFEADPDYGSGAWSYFQGPAWSANGTRLLYYGPEPAPDSPAGPGYRVHLAVVDSAGSVTSDGVVEFDPATDDEFAPAWLDGDRILYQTVEGFEHRLLVGSTAPAHDAGRDLGIKANDWITSTVSPDLATIIVSLPVASGAPPDIRAVDIATGAATPTTLGADDLSWQRLARP